MTHDNKPDGSGAIAPVLESKEIFNNGLVVRCEWRFVNIPPNAINFTLRVQRNPEIIAKRLFN